MLLGCCCTLPQGGAVPCSARTVVAMLPIEGRLGRCCAAVHGPTRDGNAGASKAAGWCPRLQKRL